MTVWLDAQLPPALSRWFHAEFQIDAVPVRDLGLRTATDRQIYLSARRETVVVMTKDRDFAELSTRLGPPPQVVLIACGDTSNYVLIQILARRWPEVARRLGSGEPLDVITP